MYTCTFNVHCVHSEKEISKERSKTDPAILIEPIPFIDRESTPLGKGTSTIMSQW